MKKNKEYLKSLKSKQTTKRSGQSSITETGRSSLTGKSEFTTGRTGQSRSHHYTEISESEFPTNEALNTNLDTACVLTEEDIFTMQEIFDKMDVHEDLILNRKEFIQALREDIRILKILHKPALYLSKVDRHMTLDRLLFQIEEEANVKSEVIQKTKEFISWNQFISYFEDYNRLPSTNPEKVALQERKKKYFQQIKPLYVIFLVFPTTLKTSTWIRRFLIKSRKSLTRCHMRTRIMQKLRVL